MDFHETIKCRRSIRSYKSDPISDEQLRRISEAVQEAPSACNLQPWSFRVVFDESTRKKISEVYTQPWLAEAPAIILALGNNDQAWKRLDGTPITDIDIGIAMEHLVLAAAAEGLGTCWICAYDVGKMNQTLNIIHPWSVLAISPLGHPDEKPKRRDRKPTKEIFQIIR